jgi:hypothetical protein
MKLYHVKFNGEVAAFVTLKSAQNYAREIALRFLNEAGFDDMSSKSLDDILKAASEENFHVSVIENDSPFFLP